MSEQDAFELILRSLHRAMLDGAEWPAASALIDEACGLTGNVLLVGEASEEDVQTFLVGLYYRGERGEELEREYMESYHHIDEAVPRFRKQPYGGLVRCADLYTEEELKTSLTFNDFFRRVGSQEALAVRLDGPGDCSHITWGTCDPVGRGGGWSSSQIEMIERVVPHIRQLVWVRRALATAGALGASLTDLLDVQRLGVIHLDRRGRIMAANDRARSVLRHGDGLSDRGGFLRASLTADRIRLEELLTSALPFSNAVPVGGSLALHRRSGRGRFTIHVKPTVVRDVDFGGGSVAALVLIVDPRRPPSVDPNQVAIALGLTPAESQVASWLAAGRTVGEIARDTGRQRRSVYWLLEQIYAKLGIRRQVDLVRLVLGVAEFA